MTISDRVRLLFRSLGVILLLASPAAAQPDQEPAEPSVAAQEAAAATSAPLPIPQADIPTMAGEVAANARRVGALVEPTTEVAAIETAIPDQAAGIVELRTALFAIDPNRTSVRRIDDQRVEWSELQGTLDGWMEVLQARWRTLQLEQAELLDTHRRWDLTREAAVSAVSAVSQEAPLEVLQRIDTTLESLSDAEASIRERSDAVANLIDRVSGGVEIAVAALERLDAMSETVSERLLTRDAEPFWRGVSGSEVQLSLNDFAQARQYWITTLVEYVEARVGQFYFLLALFALFLVGTSALRRWGRSWPADDRSLDAARHVTSRPLSTALAFTVASWEFVLPRVVGPISDIVTLLLIVPILRLGVGLVAPHVRPALYGLSAVVVVNLLLTVVPDGSVLRRLLLLILIAVTLLGATRLLSRWRAAQEVMRSRWGGVAQVGLSVAISVLAVSLAANLLGWAALSRMLWAATVVSAYSAVAWLLVVKALTGLLPIVARGVIGRRVPSIVRYEPTFIRRNALIIAVVAVLIWGHGTLVRFQLYERLGQQAEATMSASLTLGGLSLSVGSLLAALMILVLTFPVARFVRFVLQEEVLPRFRLAAGAGPTVVSLVNFSVLGMGVLLAASAAGLSATQLAVVFGALGVGIGFGLQTVVNNFVSGLILMFERPIKVGDRVEAAGRAGIVNRIGLRASMIRTFDGAEVVVPNGDLVSKEVVNWSLSDEERRGEILVGVAYGSEVKRVLGILTNVAIAHPKVLDEPGPFAQMIGFGESALNFRLFAWTELEYFGEVMSDLHEAIDEELRKAGIRIPFPQQDLHVRSVEAGSTLLVDGGAKPRIETEVE